MRDIGLQVGGQSQASGINDNGLAVGASTFYTSQTGIMFVAVLWDTINGTSTNLSTAGERLSSALAVNNNGQVVLWSESRGGISVNSVLDTITGNVQNINFDVPGHFQWASINDNGQVVAPFAPDNYPADKNGFLWQNGTTTMLDNAAEDINNIGQLVGQYIGRDGWNRPYFLEQLTGNIQDIGILPQDIGPNYPGGGRAESINDNGLIVGGSYSYNDTVGGTWHAVMWIPVPVPEPATLALLGMGAFGLLAYAWRRRKD